MQLVSLQNPRRRKPARRRNASPVANPRRRRRRNASTLTANPRRRRRRNPALFAAPVANPRRRRARRRNPVIKRGRRSVTRRRNPESLLSTLMYGGGGAVANGIVGGVPMMLPVIGSLAGSLPFAITISHVAMAFGLKYAARKLTGSQDKANLVFTGAVIEAAMQAASELVPNYQGLVSGINNQPVLMPASAQGQLGDVYAGGGPGFDSYGRGMGDVFIGSGPGFDSNFV